jgi:hypothetical protein
MESGVGTGSGARTGSGLRTGSGRGTLPRGVSKRKLILVLRCVTLVGSSRPTRLAQIAADQVLVLGAGMRW